MFCSPSDTNEWENQTMVSRCVGTLAEPEAANASALRIASVRIYGDYEEREGGPRDVALDSALANVVSAEDSMNPTRHGSEAAGDSDESGALAW